jgi:tyrosine-protein kinase Etk/Wzc
MPANDTTLSANPAFPNALDAGDSSVFSLQDAVDTLLQFWWLVASVFAILATPIYRADSLIQVEDKKGSTLPGLQQVATALDFGTSPTQGEIEIIRSREVLFKAIAATRSDIRVKVENRAPIIGEWYAARHEKSAESLAAPPYGLTRWAWGGERIAIGVFEVPDFALGKVFVIETQGKQWILKNTAGELVAQGIVGQTAEFKLRGRPGRLNLNELNANDGTKFSVVRYAPIGTYNRVLSNFKVTETARQSNVIRIAMEDPDPKFTVSFINEVARAYLSQNVDRRTEEAQKSLAFLETQLPEIKKAMGVSEEELNAFRTRTQTVNVERENDSLLQKSVAIEKDRVTLELKRKELQQRFRDDHPEIKSINEQIRTISGEVTQLSRDVSRLPEAQKDLLRLQRDVQVSTELYTGLLNSAQELRIAKAGTIANVRVIDFALDSGSPIRPRRMSIALSGAALGALLGLIAAFTARSFRPTLRNTLEVERQTGLSTYASIPESRLQLGMIKRRQKASNRPQLLCLTAPDDPSVEALRSLRTGLAFAMVDAPNKIVVITGPTASLGKSFVSANLATVLAQSGKRVLALDTDLRRPRLDVYFGIPKVPGLSDVLTGVVPFEQAVKSQRDIGVDVLTAGTQAPNPAELLLSPRFARLLEELNNRYDLIIIDSSPVLPVGDTLGVVEHAAATLLVGRAEQTTGRELTEAARRLEGAGGSVKGVIFNGVKKGRVGYGYTYKYHYNYKSQK